MVFWRATYIVKYMGFLAVLRHKVFYEGKMKTFFYL